MAIEWECPFCYTINEQYVENRDTLYNEDTDTCQICKRKVMFKIEEVKT